MKRFPTLADAGRELAASLTKFTGTNDTVVVAIATGGVHVAAEVASQLQLPFELLFIRRLLAPSGPQSVLCAINVGGTLLLDDGIPEPPANPASGADYAIADGLQQLNERVRLGRGDRPPVDLKGKTVILVDNGIHTGSTILVAIRAVRKLDVARVVVAVPVADPASRELVAQRADEIICLRWPDKFGNVGLWYEEFVRRGDDKWVNGRQKKNSEET